MQQVRIMYGVKVSKGRRRTGEDFVRTEGLAQGLERQRDRLAAWKAIDWAAMKARLEVRRHGIIREGEIL